MDIIENGKFIDIILPNGKYLGFKEKEEDGDEIVFYNKPEDMPHFPFKIDSVSTLDDTLYLKTYIEIPLNLNRRWYFKPTQRVQYQKKKYLNWIYTPAFHLEHYSNDKFYLREGSGNWGLTPNRYISVVNNQFKWTDSKPSAKNGLFKIELSKLGEKMEAEKKRLEQERLDRIEKERIQVLMDGLPNNSFVHIRRRKVWTTDTSKFIQITNKGITFVDIANDNTKVLAKYNSDFSAVSFYNPKSNRYLSTDDTKLIPSTKETLFYMEYSKGRGSGQLYNSQTGQSRHWKAITKGGYKLKSMINDKWIPKKPETMELAPNNKYGYNDSTTYVGIWDFQNNSAYQKFVNGEVIYLKRDGKYFKNNDKNQSKYTVQVTGLKTFRLKQGNKYLNRDGNLDSKTSGYRTDYSIINHDGRKKLKLVKGDKFLMGDDGLFEIEHEAFSDLFDKLHVYNVPETASNYIIEKLHKLTSDINERSIYKGALVDELRSLIEFNRELAENEELRLHKWSEDKFDRDKNNATNEIVNRSYTSKNTKCEPIKDKRIYYLDRHNLDCGEGNAITSIHMTGSGCGSKDQKFEYKCLKIGDGKGKNCETKYTNCEPADKNINYLDRHNINCPNGKYISKVRMVGGGCGKNQKKFEYRCCQFPHDNKGVDYNYGRDGNTIDKKETGRKDGNNKRLEYLDRVTIGDGKRPMRQYIHTSLGDRYYYKYQHYESRRNIPIPGITKIQPLFKKSKEEQLENQGVFMIKSKTSNRCLDTTGKTNNGTKPHQWDCNADNKNQHWTFTAYGGIKHAYSNKCLDTNKTGNGEEFYLWDCGAANDNQTFDYDKNTQLFKFRNGRCLDNTGQTSNGTRVTSWDCNADNKNQQWELSSANVEGNDELMKRAKSMQLYDEGNNLTASKRYIAYLTDVKRLIEQFKIVSTGEYESHLNHLDNGIVKRFLSDTVLKIKAWGAAFTSALESLVNLGKGIQTGVTKFKKAAVQVKEHVVKVVNTIKDALMPYADIIKKIINDIADIGKKIADFPNTIKEKYVDPLVDELTQFKKMFEDIKITDGFKNVKIVQEDMF